MDFRPTEEQQLLRRSVREFAETEVRPHVREWDERQHFPIELMSKLAALGLPLLKCEYAYGHDELERSLRRYIPAGVFPLIQEFCPGYGLGHMLLMRDGQPTLRFQHRRIHEWPPEGGFSTVCESVPEEVDAEAADVVGRYVAAPAIPLAKFSEIDSGVIVRSDLVAGS